MLRRAPCALPCLMTPDAVQMSLPAFACAPESACQADLRRPHSAGHQAQGLRHPFDGQRADLLCTGRGEGGRSAGTETDCRGPIHAIFARLSAARVFPGRRVEDGAPEARPGPEDGGLQGEERQARAQGREGFAAAFLCGGWGKGLAERTTGARRGWVRRRACPRRSAACGCPAAGRQSGRFCRRRSPSRDAGQAWRP